jgi:hypothetical protein
MVLLTDARPAIPPPTMRIRKIFEELSIEPVASSVIYFCKSVVDYLPSAF